MNPYRVYGFPLIRSKGSIFAELSESINLAKLSKQVSDFLKQDKELRDLETIKLRTSFLEMVGKTNHFLDQLSEKCSSWL